jgi:O-antigen/teichoic acid export membrane protein
MALENRDYARLLRQATLFALRGGTIAAKFMLTLYTTRYLGLAELGIYGLLVGGTTIVPAVAGLGLTDWIVRKIVGAPTAEAVPLIATRLGTSVSIHIVVQPILFALDATLGSPIPLPLAVLAGLILALDHLANEASDMLIARSRVYTAAMLGFLRAGLWPLPVIGAGFLYPETRTLEFLLLGWVVSLIVVWLILAAYALAGGRWHYLRFEWQFLPRGIAGGFSFYVKDVSNAVSAFIDRFVISFFLGLELTGVYTLFWSVANVVHSLTVFGVVQADIAKLVSAGLSRDASAFRAIERRLQIETAAWALVLSLGACIALPLLLPYLGRPLLHENLPIFWIVVAATLLRIGADGYGFVLFALQRDRIIAALAVSAAVTSALFNLLLTPLAGLYGASAAFVVTGAGLFALRYYFSRQSTSAA